jgi:hypothetical protein
MSTYRFPKTLGGWRTLFWLALGRCPIHHSKLNVDWPPYDDGVSAYCFMCEGIGIWPQGARVALWQNARAEEAKAVAGAAVPPSTT